MKIQSYLFFKDNCEEAFKFYEKALGGKIAELHPFKDMPPQEGAGGDGCGDMSPEAIKAMGEKIMHVSLAIGDQLLMGSDNPQDAGQGFQGFSVSIGTDDVNEGRKVFDALSQGGEVKMPYGKTFWAQGFGMLTDRFGVAWMVNAGDEPRP